MSGSLFLDTRNHNDFTDDYSLIYGHHMAGNAMFGEIPKFLKRIFSTNIIKLSLKQKREKKLTVTIFACLKTDAFDQLVLILMLLPIKTNKGSSLIISVKDQNNLNLLN